MEEPTSVSKDWATLSDSRFRDMTRRASPILAWLWEHSFRLLTLILVASVIFTVARQSPNPGPGATPAPAAAQTQVQPAPPQIDWPRQFAWLSKRSRAAYASLSERIPAPAGFSRTHVDRGSFADWLRHLPAAPADRCVTNARRQTVYQPGDPRLAAVIDLQPGAGNLLLAPAMLVRLRAEYLWQTQNTSKLVFHYTSGHEARWEDWAEGRRPRVQGKVVTFRQESAEDRSRDAFCGYLETLFRYTTVYSLLHDTDKCPAGTVAAGDMFVMTGRAGHAVIVLDVAADAQGRVKALLGQGGNPAQTFHVLRAPDGDPWFTVSQSNGINLGTGGTLKLKDLRRWKE